MPLIEGTDGTGAKMSKSKGNYVGLDRVRADDVFGKIMSMPDRLMEPYLQGLDGVDGRGDRRWRPGPGRGRARCTRWT